MTVRESSPALAFLNERGSVVVSTPTEFGRLIHRWEWKHLLCQ